MTSKKPLSRRTFLQGAGGVFVALPFLDAMIPTFAHAQSAPVKRFITTFGGTVVSSPTFSIPSAVGPLGTLPGSWTSLQALKNHVSIISNLLIPVYNPSLGQAYIPGGSHSGQHGFTMASILAGIGTVESQQIRCAGTTKNRAGMPTSDQIAAAVLGATTRFPSLQVKTQVNVYNGQSGVGGNGIMSARRSPTGLITALPPVISPLELYNKLFTGSVPTTPPMPTATPAPGGTPVPTPAPTPTPNPNGAANLLLRRRSVLDVVLEDAKRLLSQVGSEDKARLELHFEEIRTLEKSVSNSLPPPTGAFSKVAAGAGCAIPSSPGADPAIGTLGFGGWSGETQRGEIQADLIAYAIACDLTRVVSWMLTNDQCWLGNQNISGTNSDIHACSHQATADIRAANTNWHAALFGKLVNNLLIRTDAHGTLLDNTFMSLVFAEGTSAHSRNFVHLVAGNSARVRTGLHISAAGAHPAQLQIAGLQSVGVNTNTLGEVSGVLPNLLK